MMPFSSVGSKLNKPKGGHHEDQRQASQREAAFAREAYGGRAGEVARIDRAWPVGLVAVPDNICQLAQITRIEPEPTGLTLVFGHRCRIEIGRQFDTGTFSRLVAFSNRSRSMAKVLSWDRNGFCLWPKRLGKDRFRWPEGRQEVLEVDRRGLSWLLDGLELRVNNRPNGASP
ncbi:MAG: IS66 family insertion sequence element accessory protein TnpB [Desulfobulbaceae bacterium]|nr:IS66 family insertion sequence element accessory protein TnpB [Desulfobulbaceae bacterium]